MAESNVQKSACEAQQSGVCSLCLKKLSQYTCPRCNVRYCSSGCYKSEAHSTCSESFYRDCFMDGLKDMQNSAEDRQKMLEMLTRLEDENPVLDSDDELQDGEIADLQDRLAGVDLDNHTDKVWNRLTELEKTEFRDMLQDGRLGSLVELWQPWWGHKDLGLVEEISEEPQVSGYHPRIITDIPNIDELLKKKNLSNNLPYSVVNILYGYAYMARLHNGTHLELPQQTSQGIVQLCGTLQGQSFTSTAEALSAAISCLHNQAKDLFVSREFSVGVLQDVKFLLEGPSPRLPLTYVMSAISDLHHIITAARSSVSKELKKAKKEGQVKHASSLQARRQRLFSAGKKLEFLLSWVHKYGLQLVSIPAFVDLEFCSLSSELASYHADKTRLEKAWGGSRPPRKMNRFIEEIGNADR